MKKPTILFYLIHSNGITLKASERLLSLVQDPHSSIPITSLIMILVFALFGILCLVWCGTLLYKGFKITTNARGRNLIVGTLLGIILAEALSKFIFIYIF